MATQIFRRLLISNEQQLSDFAMSTEQQGGWNDRETFLQKLTSEPMDFQESRFVLYRMTEGSISVGLTPQIPYVEDSTLHLSIARSVPGGQLSQSAFYVLVYKVNKSIDKIRIDNGKTIETVHIGPPRPHRDF